MCQTAPLTKLPPGGFLFIHEIIFFRNRVYRVYLIIGVGGYMLHASENPSSILCVVSGLICTFFIITLFQGLFILLCQIKHYHTIPYLSKQLKFFFSQNQGRLKPPLQNSRGGFDPPPPPPPAPQKFGARAVREHKIDVLSVVMIYGVTAAETLTCLDRG